MIISRRIDCNYIVSLIMASGWNDDENHGQSLGYKGYQWEPEYAEEEFAELPSDSQDRNTEYRNQCLCFCQIDRTIPLLSKAEISSL